MTTLIILGGTNGSTHVDKSQTVEDTGSGGPNTDVKVHVAISNWTTG